MGPLKERFFGSLADDFNTPEALAAVYDWVREANRRQDEGDEVGDADLREMLGVLALENLLDADGAEGPDAAALALAAEREEARAARDFQRADALRDELLERGWQVRDGPAGPELVPR
jgi:cysteinyl-tRNA synthetase